MTANRQRRESWRSRHRVDDHSYGDQVPFALQLFPERDWSHVELDTADLNRIRKAIAQPAGGSSRGPS